MSSEDGIGGTPMGSGLPQALHFLFTSVFSFGTYMMYRIEQPANQNVNNNDVCCFGRYSWLNKISFEFLMGLGCYANAFYLFPGIVDLFYWKTDSDGSNRSTLSYWTWSNFLKSITTIFRKLVNFLVAAFAWLSTIALMVVFFCAYAELLIEEVWGFSKSWLCMAFIVGIFGLFPSLNAYDNHLLDLKYKKGYYTIIYIFVRVAHFFLYRSIGCYARFINRISDSGFGNVILEGFRCCVREVRDGARNFLGRNFTGRPVGAMALYQTEATEPESFLQLGLAQ